MTLEDVGVHFESNSLKLDKTSRVEWEIALRKAEKHLDYRLWNKTKFGAHSVENLHVPAKEYYLNFAYMSIINGSWEWKEDYDLPEQLIRIIDSRLSTVVETYKKAILKNKERRSEGRYEITVTEKAVDVEGTFYDLRSEEELSEEELLKIESEYESIEKFVSESDNQNIIDFWECVKERYTRGEIAEYIGITPKQLDKVKEKFLRQIRKEIKSSEK